MICKICGKEFEGIRFAAPNNNICSSECYTDNYWLERANNPENFIIINGTCYYVDDEQGGAFRGFDGQRFEIRMLADGTTFTTTNLWYNGPVPEKYRDRLPDTAEFVR